MWLRQKKLFYFRLKKLFFYLFLSLIIRFSNAACDADGVKKRHKDQRHGRRVLSAIAKLYTRRAQMEK